MFTETCIAPINIAVIKYWGKRDEELILPLNDSISMTINTDELCAKTTVAASEDFTENKIWLNGEEQIFDGNVRVLRCIKGIKRLAVARGNLRFPITWKLHIASKNNFPTAAGLASSAAGYACLVYTLARLYNLSLDEEITTIARMGSGSACRSLHGGFVHWRRGLEEDGSDSKAVQVAPAVHWPNMHMLILVVTDQRKKTSSTKGMQRAVKTSELLKYRAEFIVPQRVKDMIRAIETRNFENFANITMRESSQFHAIALDTYPPCVYMTDVSHAIVNFLHAYNKAVGYTRVAYTFDAGPNACLYILEEHVAHLVFFLNMAFPFDSSLPEDYIKGIPIKLRSTDDIEPPPINPVKNLFKYIIHTKIGNGPTHIVDKEQSLLTPSGHLNELL